MSKEKRLLIISGSNKQGGAERQLSKLLGSVIEYKVSMICFSRYEEIGEFSNLKNLNKFEYYTVNIRNPCTIYKSLKYSIALIDNQIKSTVIVGWLGKGNLYALLLGVLRPFKTKLFCCHRSLFSLRQSIVSRVLLIFTLIIYFIYPKRIHHVTNSSAIASSIITKFLLRSKTIVIPNCYENKNTQTSKKEKRNEFQEHNSLKLIIVARFSKEKGYETLFKCLNEVKIPFKLRCIGTGCCMSNPDFKRLCDQYSIDPIAKETVSEILEEYRKSDFLILPSYSEAFPNVIVESLLAGTPVISTPTGPFLDLLRPYGLVAKSFSYKDIKVVISRAAKIRSSQEVYLEVSNELSKRINDYILTPSEAAKKYELLFNKQT